MVVEKPAEIFDRDVEWDELVRFARLPHGGARLGVVSGRRRQGKTFLLDALVRAGGGFMFTATESSQADALRQYGEALGGFLGEATPLRFVNWDEAITRTMTLAPGGPLPVVIDEFPFLARASPALPSIIQRAFDPAAQRSNTRVRLLLCGSALSFMGGLLSGAETGLRKIHLLICQYAQVIIFNQNAIVEGEAVITSSTQADCPFF
jgi:hypothetical protein